jgi:hypothetical protein
MIDIEYSERPLNLFRTTPHRQGKRTGSHFCGILWGMAMLLGCLAAAAMLAVYPSTTTTTTPRWVRLPLEIGGDLTVPCAFGREEEANAAAVSCRLEPLPSVTFNADGKPIVATAFTAGDGMCTCRVPPVNAAAGASLSFSTDNQTFVPAAVNVVFYATWSPSLGKRPYLSTDDSGSIVVMTDKGAGGSGRIVCQEVELNAVVAAGATVALPFSLHHLPRTFDGFLNVTMFRKDGLPPLHRSLRLMRVPPKPAAVMSFSWLDYSRRAIMVNDTPLVPVGFYSTWPPAQGGFKGLLADLAGQAKQGINVVMQYQGDASALNSSQSWNSDVGGCLVVMPGQLQQDCDNQTQIFLDHAASVGVHVMIDLAALFREIVCGQFAPSSKSCPAAGAGVRAGADPNANLPSYGPESGWAAVEKGVKRYQNHPALLGWYVCDDCMTSWISAQRAAGTPTVDTMYNRLKQLDPYHIVIGAVESVDMFVFEVGNVFVPEASLDVPMLENYVSTVVSNADLGPMYDQPGSDGSLRSFPLDWQPMINCPGPYMYDGRPGRRPGITEQERADVTYSLGWISAVTANMPQQLFFRRAYGGNTTGLLMERAGQYQRITTRFSDYLFASPPPNTAAAAAAAAAAGFQRGGALSSPAASTRAGLWIKAVGGSGGGSGGGTASFCGLLVVVNLLERNQSIPPVSQRVNVTLSKTMLARWPAAAGATAQCVDGGADSARFENGVLANLLISGENTAVFQVSNGPLC